MLKSGESYKEEPAAYMLKIGKSNLKFEDENANNTVYCVPNHNIEYVSADISPQVIQ